MSEKSPAGAVIPVLASSGRAERALLGPGWRKTGWNPPIRGVQVYTEDETEGQNENSGLYDLIESFLAPYGHGAALQVGRDLDAKVEELLQAAAN